MCPVSKTRFSRQKLGDGSMSGSVFRLRAVPPCRAHLARVRRWTIATSSNARGRATPHTRHQRVTYEAYRLRLPAHTRAATIDATPVTPVTYATPVTHVTHLTRPPPSPRLPRSLATLPKFLKKRLFTQRIHGLPEARVFKGHQLPISGQSLHRLAFP